MSCDHRCAVHAQGGDPDLVLIAENVACIHNRLHNLDAPFHFPPEEPDEEEE